MKRLTLEQKLLVKYSCLHTAKELVLRDPLATTPVAMAQKLVDAAQVLEKYFEEK
ncbi:unnamed protein product [marine sediment metagenome]|uniref:Uncharacterized protein n=1 Tax=marine sediment metagenome TaxID=412755 RepID=X0T4S7_9ZZZZ